MSTTADGLTRPQAVELARRLWEDGDGWTVAEIRQYLADRGQSAAWSTVKGWADPDWWERRQAAHRRRWRERSASTLNGVTPGLLLALRLEDGLSYNAIAKVARRFFGEELTEDQVRHRVYELGVAKNPNKTRARLAAGERRAA